MVDNVSEEAKFEHRANEVQDVSLFMEKISQAKEQRIQDGMFINGKNCKTLAIQNGKEGG